MGSISLCIKSKSSKIFKMITIIAFNNGKSSFLAAILAVLTSLSFMEVDPELYRIQEDAIFTQDSKFVFEYLTDSSHVSLYFQMVNWFVERKIDNEISVGKEYECRITLPIVGMKNQHFTVTNYTPNSMLTLKSSNGISNPALTLKVSAAGPNQAKVTFLLYFDKKSM